MYPWDLESLPSQLQTAGSLIQAALLCFIKQIAVRSNCHSSELRKFHKLVGLTALHKFSGEYLRAEDEM